ncbi:MAG: gluconate 2-dehydrogenase subunit 3 family protein, partial [Cyclobacteriaceae bacterium]
MDRRESLKSLLIGSVGGGILLTGCSPENETPPVPLKSESSGYGRTEMEKAHDQKIYSEVFLNDHELETIAVLCDIILPANAEFGSATEAGVPDFIKFIVKDIPAHQLPIRGGIAWLDNYSNAKFSQSFINLTEDQQFEICDAIAYPGKTKPENLAGE